MLRVGTSGYQYSHWRGDFYPEKLPRKQWFAHYAEHFDCVEINNTFYQLPAAATFDAWREAALPGFRYALKLSRFATHQKKLRDPDRTLDRFLERAERLRSFLGPILVQLPPSWHASEQGDEANGIRLVPIRHEAAGVHMAEGLYETGAGAAGFNFKEMQSAAREGIDVTAIVFAEGSVVCIRSSRDASVGTPSDASIRFVEAYQGPF